MFLIVVSIEKQSVSNAFKIIWFILWRCTIKPNLYLDFDRFTPQKYHKIVFAGRSIFLITHNFVNYMIWFWRYFRCYQNCESEYICTHKTIDIITVKEICLQFQASC